MTNLSIISEVIADTIAEEIIRGVQPPGVRLAQDAIASRFQCSHVPVREALQRLVQMELATSEPRKGVRVVALASSDHVEIQEMRLALEPLALRRAVIQVQGKTLREIEDYRLLCDDAKDAISWERANRAFHMAILRPCGRHRLLKQIEELQRLSANRFHTKWQQKWAQSSDRDHANIVRAMRAGDADAACAVLERHLKRA
ncbi:GntR family transcriptional regulator [Octadecabacter ascidiaceicola]|uniref:HTH-type transcriptional repressor CsiR n=1 Tax=Octadecabacter ascidiaceicola TaxID=1655543 RepID=A0A238K2I5_9RHOB|nr:GntR family transcriptional regulator [Octadecabacter ascidiaceicola]SMX36983.1 HTH-type transcriptional repressor CsiR [Octadecabacter ascidiaceicola]